MSRRKINTAQANSVTEDPALQTYRKKRSAARSVEPFGTRRDTGTGLFVVQKHHARRLHYDFRLELGGTLRSWAVPKGPSLDPSVKRLAVQVEDHPVEYADFEGVIADGNYGAGEVIVWDRGQWLALDDPEAGLMTGKLLFELKGYKLRGVWTLVRTKRDPKEWLLIKKPDAWARTEADQDMDQHSVLSGLTVEQRKLSAKQLDPLRRKLTKLKAVKRQVSLQTLKPMLAVAYDKPFSHKDWLFELKYDGYRLLACRMGGQVRLQYRHGSDASKLFPEIVTALKALPTDFAVLDGEVVVLDDQGHPSFQRLQQRTKLKRQRDIEAAKVALPATLFVFDLLGFEDFDLRSLKLADRKAALAMLAPRVGPVRYADHVDTQGEALLRGVATLELEGIVAKKKDSVYRSIRSDTWRKIRLERKDTFRIVGFSLPESSRTGFGALLLGDGKLVYAGRVGTGFSEAQLNDIRQLLEPLRIPKPPCIGPIPKGSRVAWVRPDITCEVRYRERTNDGLLRLPVFVRLGSDETRDSDPTPEAIEPTKHVVVTNPDKIFWPKQRYTKAKLVDYYRQIARWLLPYLKDRPVVMVRYPDGIGGKSFFQKDAPDYVPEWIRTERMWSEHTQREIDYFICDDEESLAYVINLGTIPLHIWSARIDNLQRPDWCVLDLDPKDAPFAHVIQIARVIHTLCTRVGWPCYVKTTGSTGLHILLPLGNQVTHDLSRQLAELLCRIVAKKLPDISTMARPLAARKGKVYLDAGQNGHGKLIVAPFSVRPVDGAPVSMPLRWNEVDNSLRPRKFTIANAKPRMTRLRRDPLLSVLQDTPDLPKILERLAKLQ